jgi:hypothetical protein
MYGVSGGLSPSDLYTVDLATGRATKVGTTGVRLGSLEFGPDGNLYAGGNLRPDAGKLFRIDRDTGASTLVGETGFEVISGLALRKNAHESDVDFYQVEVGQGQVLIIDSWEVTPPSSGLSGHLHLRGRHPRQFDMGRGRLGL